MLLDPSTCSNVARRRPPPRPRPRPEAVRWTKSNGGGGLPKRDARFAQLIARAREQWRVGLLTGARTKQVGGPGGLVALAEGAFVVAAR